MIAKDSIRKVAAPTHNQGVPESCPGGPTQIKRVSEYYTLKPFFHLESTTILF